MAQTDEVFRTIVDCIVPRSSTQCHQYIEYPDDRIEIDGETIQVIRNLVSRLGETNMEPVPEILSERTA